MTSKQMLIVCNKPPSNTHAPDDAALAGAPHESVENTRVVFKT